MYRLRSLRNCYIVPPHIFKTLLQHEDKAVREAALRTMLSTTHLGGERAVRAFTAVAAGPDAGRRTIYDCHHSTRRTNAVAVRTEDGPAPADSTVNRAFDGFAATVA